MLSKSTVNRKILLLCMLIAAWSVISCKKNSVPTPDYSGTYVGDIQYSNNGVQQQTLHNYQIQFSINADGEVIIGHSVFEADSAMISANILQVPKTLVASNTDFNLYDVGQGTFTGNTCELDFYENTVSNYNSMIASSQRWTGTLTRQ